MRRIILLVTVGAVVAATMAIAGTASAAPGSTDPDVPKRLAEVRQATAKYHDVSVAEADGYVDVSGCVPEMGHHYLNTNNDLMDRKINPLEPDVLLYAPSGDGLRLVGVEYIELDPLRQLTAVPTLFGVVPFDGPMTHHLLPNHYDLHVWTGQANPDGIFTAHNPNVRC